MPLIIMHLRRQPVRTDTGPRTKTPQSFRIGRKESKNFQSKALPHTAVPAAALAGSVHSISATRVRGALCA